LVGMAPFKIARAGAGLHEYCEDRSRAPLPPTFIAQNIETMAVRWLDAAKILILLAFRAKY